MLITFPLGFHVTLLESGSELDGFEYLVPNPLVWSQVYAAIYGEVACVTAMALLEGENAGMYDDWSDDVDP